MKNWSVFSAKLFLFIFVSLRKTRQYICSPICFALTIIYLKIIAKKLLGPLNLTRTRVFYIYKAAKAVRIGKDEDFMLTTF